MTVQYQGNSLWSIHIGDRKIDLTESEIEKIQGYNFSTGKEIKSAHVLQDTITRLEELLENSHKILDGYENEIDNLNNYLEEALDGR